jgi:hypothetical protein
MQKSGRIAVGVSLVSLFSFVTWWQNKDRIRPIPPPPVASEKIPESEWKLVAKISSENEALRCAVKEKYGPEHVYFGTVLMQGNTQYVLNSPWAKKIVIEKSNTFAPVCSIVERSVMLQAGDK